MTHDPAKRRSNKRKHKIDLAECEAAFDAPMLTREDAERQTHMSKKRTSGNTRKSELPYDPNDRAAVLSFWEGAKAHRGWPSCAQSADDRARLRMNAKNKSRCDWMLMFSLGTVRKGVVGRLG